MGPWYKDHARAAGIGQQRVGIADQAALGILRDADDDAQAFTGSIFQWLAAAGVNVGILGKDQNGRVATDPIPAGVTFAKIQLVGAAYDPTLWSATYVEYSGANPAYGVGVSPPATTQYFYNLAATATWASGEARVTTTIQHRFRVGDTVAVNMNVAGYNGNQFVVSAVESATVFRYAVGGPLGSTSGFAYNRQTYGAIQLGGWATQFFDVQADTDPFFLYIAPHSPHEDEGGGYGSAIEKLYAGAVDPSAVAPGGALTTTYAEQIAVGYVATSTQRTTYEDRQELMASIDDMVKTLVDYLTARWGDNWTIIFTTDQGIQNGEQSAWGTARSKPRSGKVRRVPCSSCAARSSARAQP